MHHHRLVDDLLHLVAYTEGPEVPQKIQSAHPHLLHGLRVGPPVQSGAQVDTQVLEVLNNSSLLIHDVSVYSQFCPPKTNHLLLGLVHI